MHDLSSLAGFATKALTEKISDIRLIVQDDDAYTHDATSAIFARKARGSRTVNSVNSPTRLSISTVPPCC